MPPYIYCSETTRVVNNSNDQLVQKRQTPHGIIFRATIILVSLLVRARRRPRPRPAADRQGGRGVPRHVPDGGIRVHDGAHLPVRPDRIHYGVAGRVPRGTGQAEARARPGAAGRAPSRRAHDLTPQLGQDRALGGCVFSPLRLSRVYSPFWGELLRCAALRKVRFAQAPRAQGLTSNVRTGFPG